MKYKYYVKDLDQKPEGAKSFESNTDPEHPEWIAAEAAEIVWERDDGREWRGDVYVITLLSEDGGELGDFEIWEVEMKPSFRARKVKQ